MEYYTRYNPPPSPEADLGSDSLTRQEFRDECDINHIVARAGAGLVNLQIPAAPLFTDVSEVPSDYQECLEHLFNADEQFASLPSRVRERFGNDPSQLFSFLADSANRDEAVKLGLIAATVAPEKARELKQVEKPINEPSAS